MALTTGSRVFRCTREQAIFVVECANLRHEITSVPRPEGVFTTRP